MDCDSSCWRRNTFLSCQGPCKQVMKQPHIYWSQPGYILHIFGPMAPRAKSVNRIPDGIPEEFQDRWGLKNCWWNSCCKRPVCNDCDLKSSWNFRRVMFTRYHLQYIYVICIPSCLAKLSMKHVTTFGRPGWLWCNGECYCNRFAVNTTTLLDLHLWTLVCWIGRYPANEGSEFLLGKLICRRSK